MKPTKVPLKVVGVEDQPVGYGVETRPLASLVLQGVNICDDWIGLHRCGDDVPLNQKDTGKITALNSCHGQLDDAGQSLGNAAGREEDLSSIGKGEGELGERVSLGDSPIFGNIQVVAPYSSSVGQIVRLIPHTGAAFETPDPSGGSRVLEASLRRPPQPAVDLIPTQSRPLVKRAPQTRERSGCG